MVPIAACYYLLPPSAALFSCLCCLKSLRFTAAPMFMTFWTWAGFSFALTANHGPQEVIQHCCLILLQQRCVVLERVVRDSLRLQQMQIRVFKFLAA